MTSSLGFRLDSHLVLLGWSRGCFVPQQMDQDVFCPVEQDLDLAASCPKRWIYFPAKAQSDADETLLIHRRWKQRVLHPAVPSATPGAGTRCQGVPGGAREPPTVWELWQRMRKSSAAEQRAGFAEPPALIR